MPREVIPGDDDNPYALKTDLGWGIIGRTRRVVNEDEVTEDERSSTGVNHETIVCKVIGDPCRRSSFSFKTRAKEIINPEQINRIFEIDFSETSSVTEK